MFRRMVRSWVLDLVRASVQEWIGEAQRDATSRIEALEEQNAKLEKKLSMAMGAVQAATAQIMQVKEGAEQAGSLARQAMQKATGAEATAEAAADGVSRLERFEPPQPDRPDGKPVELCKVEGCTSRARTKGMCNKHYQQWKRAELVV